MKIEYYKDILKNKSKGFIKKYLSNTLEEIEFLESIYRTGGINNFYSDKFKDSAFNERQELCQKSSAMFSILREVIK